MDTKICRLHQLLILSVALMAAFTAAPLADAADVKPSALDTSEATGYLGEWILSVDFGGQIADLTLALSDVDGKIAAVLNSSFQPEPQHIEDITKTDEGLKFVFEAGLGTMTLVVKLSGDQVFGTLVVGEGGFSGSFTGARPSAKAPAPDIEASSLPISGGGQEDGGFGGFRGYLGEWALTVDVSEESPIRHLLLAFYDIDGNLGATLQASGQAQPQVITDIEVSSLALKLRYLATAGESETSMTLIVRLGSGGVLDGSLAEELGLLVQASSSVQEESLGLGLFAARVKGIKGGKIPGRTLLDFAGDIVKVTYVPLQSGTSDHERLLEIEDGSVFQFTSARATKLFTDADLSFGDTVIKTENAGKNYPGVYSLWLKKVGDGWHLVFNEEADVWGTMHNPSADVAEVPLTLSKADTEKERLEVDLQKNQDGGVIRVAWGAQEWSATFSVVQ